MRLLIGIFASPYYRLSVLSSCFSTLLLPYLIVQRRRRERLRSLKGRLQVVRPRVLYFVADNKEGPFRKPAPLCNCGVVTLLFFLSHIFTTWSEAAITKLTSIITGAIIYVWRIV